jgi:steroid 5-alpha reductase family enzyme
MGGGIVRATLAAVDGLYRYVPEDETDHFLFAQAFHGLGGSVFHSLAFGLYYVGFSLFAGPVSAPLGAAAYVGIALFLIGSLINSGSELIRDKWKKNPANKGVLYTGGLFRYSMHVNYFGDLLWVSGLAFMTANIWSVIVPLLLFCLFAFFNAPMLDKHLAEKYGDAFEEYRAKTKKIIPFIY